MTAPEVLFDSILKKNQVEVHQTAVERTLRLDTPELTFLFYLSFLYY